MSLAGLGKDRNMLNGSVVAGVSGRLRVWIEGGVDELNPVSLVSPSLPPMAGR